MTLGSRDMVGQSHVLGEPVTAGEDVEPALPVSGEHPCEC
jgi:hypothetical protein